MAPPNNPAVVKVAMVGNRDTREWVNTFHVSKSSGSMVAADLLTIAQTFYNWYHNVFKVQVPTICALDTIQVRKLDPSDPIGLDYATGLPEPGTLGGTAAPANVTLSLSWRTGFAGRKYRGRFYAPGMSEGDLSTDDRASSVRISALLASMANLLAAVSTAGPYSLAVFHKFDNSYTNIITEVVDAILDIQRRRLPARGR